VALEPSTIAPVPVPSILAPNSPSPASDEAHELTAAIKAARNGSSGQLHYYEHRRSSQTIRPGELAAVTGLPENMLASYRIPGAQGHVRECWQHGVL
jgi:hypothetical protein